MAPMRTPTAATVTTPTDVRACIGVVLAGGRSTRMGRDKALLDWHGRPLIEHQIALLHASGLQTVHVSGERPGYAGVPDAQADAGPIGGLAGIAAASADALLLVIPVDMPRLRPALLQRLREAHSDAGCVRFGGHVLPMRLRLDASLRRALSALLAEVEPGRRSLRALQQRVGLVELPLAADEAAALLDCNTLATWKEVCA